MRTEFAEQERRDTASRLLKVLLLATPDPIPRWLVSYMVYLMVESLR